MGDLSRTIRCSNCDCANSINISSGLELREVVISGKCQNCNSAIQLNFSLVEKPSQSQVPSLPVSREVSTPMANFDDVLQAAELPTDSLRSIMED